MSLLRKKTKVVATIGPSCSQGVILKEMILSGVDVFRINCSHTNKDDLFHYTKTIRELNQELGSHVAVLADLQGPKLRIGQMAEGVFLNPEDLISFVQKDVLGSKESLYMNYEGFAKDVRPKETVLLDDGKIVLEILETNQKDLVKAKVIQGGPVYSKKGVNLPNTKIDLPALTQKDIQDTLFAIEAQVDWLALSFVRTPKDLLELRAIIEKHSAHKIPIIAKIEKPEAVNNLQEIIKNCDGLMVARGDLGVEFPAHKVPLIQKRIVEQAKMHAKPVIIATQMMESMMKSLTPSRADVNDVANAVIDGADAVMLSGETSVGDHPVAVIRVMSEIALAVEDNHRAKAPLHEPEEMSQNTRRYISNIVCYTAAKAAKQTHAKAILGLTITGHSTFQISSHRPSAFILSFTSNRDILCALNLLWGVKPFYYDGFKSTDETIKDLIYIAEKENYIKKGDIVLNVSAMPVDQKGATNTLRISTVK